MVLCHPVLLSPETRARWTQIFGDYEILQPLPQLAREIFSIRDEERGETQILRARGATTTRGRLFALSRRGWTARVENGWIEEYLRALGCGAHARIAVAPGLPVDGGGEGEHTLTVAACTYPLERLSPIDFSELVRDLESLRR